LAKAEPDFLRAAIVDARLCDQDGIEQLFKIVSEEMQGDPALKADRKLKYPLVIGKKVTHPGVYIGDLKAGDNTIRMNLIPDFVRDDFGEVVRCPVRNAVDIVDGFNQLNGLALGCDYGIREVCQDVERQKFKNGALFLAHSRALLDIGEQLSSNPELATFGAICRTGFLCVTSTYSEWDCRGRNWRDCYVSFGKDATKEIWHEHQAGVLGNVLLIRGTLAAPAP
jgi:hypothetical protein